MNYLINNALRQSSSILNKNLYSQEPVRGKKRIEALQKLAKRGIVIEIGLKI